MIILSSLLNILENSLNSLVKLSLKKSSSLKLLDISENNVSSLSLL
jgi:hypothetical protein